MHANRWAIALSLVALGGVPACSQLLAGGLVAGQALQPISDDQEVQIGRAAAQQVLSDPKTPPAPQTAVTSYVTSIGQAIAAKSERPNLPYEFHVIVSPDLNAFALPGGQIFVTTAAVAAMKDESELAGVLGHEIGHVAHKHGIDKLREQMVAQGIAVAALGGSPQLVQQAGGIALNLVFNGFSRDFENQADQFGCAYENAAGYDPHGLGNFLGTIAQKLGDTPKVFEPLSDHPAISARVSALNGEISQQRLAATATNAQAFLAATQALR
jgi:predicted Zn-dependent protease